MNSDAKIDLVLKELNKLRDDMKHLILVNTSLVQEIANQINTKIDILCNIENVNSNAKVSQNKKVLTKTMFFKSELKKDINKYINILYSQEDLDGLYNNPEVKSKKTELQKKNKIIDLLYIQITKNNLENNLENPQGGKMISLNEKLKIIYEEYKKNLNINSDDDNSITSEETKEDN